MRRTPPALVLLMIVVLLTGALPGAPALAKSAMPDGDSAALTASSQNSVSLDGQISAAGAPTSPPQRPSLRLGVLVAPDVIGIGETASITLTVDNRDGIAATNLVVTLPAPDGAVALPGPGWIGATQGWHWDLGAFAGPSTVLTASLQLTTIPTSNVLLLRARATAGNIPGPIDARGGALVIDRSANPVTAPFTPGTPTQLRSRDGRVAVQFPGAGASRPLTLRFRHDPLPGKRQPWGHVNGRTGLAPIFLDATDAQQNEVHQFTAPLTLTVAYTPEQLQALDVGEADLTLFWFDESQNSWVPLPTTIDSATHTVSAQVDHFSAFQLSDGSSPSKAYLPSLQGFQLSTYTGAASTQIPINLPAGPGGLKPALSLNYSSSATDGRGGERPKWQAGWVGKGWSLEAGSVALDRSTAGTGWNHFSFTFSGQSFDVVRGPMTGAPINSRTCTDYSNDQSFLECWQWHSADENFARMRAIPLQATATTSATVEWQAWTKDGTRYDFGLPLWWAWHNDDNTRTHEPYKWLLTGVTDTHGNTITYIYHVDSVGMPVVPGQPLVLGHPTWYLQSINWGYDGATPGTGTPRYQVSFDVSNRTTAAPTQGVDPNWEYFNSTVDTTWQASAPHEIYRLDAINVKSMPQSGGTYQLMHRYQLEYATVGSSIHTDDYLAGDPTVSQPVLTLLDVQEVGSDGTTMLPKRMFIYGTNPGSGDTRPPEYNRLTTIQNSEGGQLSFTYAHAFAKTDVPTGECWCNYRNYNRVTQTLAQDTSGQSYAKSALTTYDYTNSGQNTASLNDENHAATVVYAHYPPSGTGDGRMYLARLEKTEFRGHWYVTEKHYDGATTGMPLLQEVRHWFYQGNGGSANTTCIPHRHSVGTNKSALDASELDPTGNPNSCFQQMFRSEAFKGHEYQTEIRDNNSALILQTLHSFTRQDLPFFGSDPGFFNSNPAFETQSANYKRNGLWRAFVFENQITENSYEAGSLIRPKTTKYFYNPACDPAGAVDTYGNLGCTQELNATGGIFRTTKHWFNNRNDGLTGSVWGSFIVDRMWQQATYDDQGRLAALTNQFYDGNNTVANTVGTKGELTRMAKYYDAPPQAISASGPVLPNGTIHSSDTSSTYDTYGNQASATTYASAGTRTDSSGAASWSAPGSSSHARATTTSYDGIFHSFPMTVTNALGQAEHADYNFLLGTLIRVSGLNVTTAATDCHPASFSIPVGEETTCAQYDVFGRMIKLIKPGDSSSAPTVQAVYHDIGNSPTLPIQYELKRRDTSTDGFRETQLFYDGLGHQIETKAESQDNAQNIVTDMVYDGMDRITQQSQPHYLPESGGIFTSYTPPTGGLLTNPTATSYDALGRVSTVLTPDGKQTSHFYLVWNDNGVPRVAHNVVDAKRHRTKSSTDVAGRLIKVEEIGGNCGQWSFTCASPYTSTWALYATTNYTYTALDQLGGVTDTNGNHTVNTDDSLGRKTQALDPDLGLWAYTYDANSNVLSQTDARGKRICFFYDDLDRLTNKHYQDTTSACPAGAPNSTNDVSYGYDQNALGLGHRTAMSIVGGASTIWTYDARGRKLTEIYSNVPGLAAGQTRQFTWTYDVADRVQTLAYPATASVPTDTVTYAYDAAWRQTSLASSRGGLSASASQPATALDQPSQWTFGNGAIQTWTYTTPMQRVARIQATSGASTVLDHSYGYDFVGNVAAITDTVNLPAVQDFDYDHRDRLIHSGPAHASGLGMAALVGAPAVIDSVGAGTPATAASALAFELHMPGDNALTTSDVPPAPTTPTTAASAPSAPKPAAAAIPAAANRPDFGRLPLAFVPNQGQTDAQARFLVHGAGGTLFFTPGEAVLTLPDPSDTVTTTVVRLRYVGANAAPTISARNALPGVVNYLIGGDAAKWRTNVPTYAGISYGALYSGIDLHYDGTDGKLKSTYVVAPNADPSQIRWRYLGARDLQINSTTGDLTITLGGLRRGRTLTEHAPLAWQDVGGTRVPVSARFDVAANGSVGFALGNYDHTQPLTIDPILTYSTYHGGNRDDKATAIVVDSSGQAIVAGYTTSNTGFPLLGALFASYRGNTDAFVSKFNAAGSALVFSTYIGGSNEDKANAITLDPSGNIVIAGETASGGATPFPTVGAMDSSFASGGLCSGGTCADVFISKLNAAGSSLLYSTFFGGTGVEEATGVAADSGAIYATGIVTATGMTTKNPYDSSYNGLADAFVIKVNPSVSGSTGLLYSTFLGGTSDDEGHALALGSSGKVYLTGFTKSSAYPTKNAYQGSNAGGQDAFVTAIDTTLSGSSSLLYSTYLGGSATDEGDGIVLDASSNAYITGSTTSSAWPTKTPWQSTIAGDHDVILTEVNPAATGAASLVYSTYLGGIRDDRGQAIARDSSGVLYLTGYTTSITYPTTLAVQPTFGGGTCGTISCTDAFVTAFNITANAPVYSTFLGNNNNDQGLAIAADSSGAAYVAGYTDGTFPTASPRQAASGGQRDAFVAKLSQPTVALSAATTSVAEGAGVLNLTVTLSAASPVTVTVDYTTANGTATAGSDYTAQSGTLTFVPNTTTQTISVPITNDVIDEPNETFSVTLSGPVGARLGSIPLTTVTITDDDAPPAVAWQGANTNVGEAAGSALVPVILNASSAFTITVQYATSNGTATAGSDYTASSGTLTFAPSQTSLNVSIPITNDATAEPNETVNLTLSSPTNATIGGTNPATLTIVDNDGGSSGADEYEQYDALGNLLQKGATAYTYGATASSCVAGTPASKPHAATAAGASSYSYDCDGNMLSGGTRTSLQWDTENRLISVMNAGVTETYGYDADGERITRATGGGTTVYLGGLWEETSAGAVKQYYAFNGTVVAVRDSSAGVSYLHGDHLGSVSATTGAQAGGQTFGPWGNVTSSSSSATARNYTGQYLDSASGLLYYHARYYDATLARFISADSVVPGQSAKTGTANPQQLNRYSYVTNNPLNQTDPTGQMGSEIGDTNSGMPDATSSSMGFSSIPSGQGCECSGSITPPESIVPPTDVTPATTQMGPEGVGADVAVENPAEMAAKQSTAAQGSDESYHVYEIQRTNNATGETSTWKYGISGDAVSEDLTTSRRLQYQVNKANNNRYNNVGGNQTYTYRGRILAYNIPDESLALEMEHELVNRYAAEEQRAGRPYEGPIENKLPRPVKPELNRYLK